MKNSRFKFRVYNKDSFTYFDLDLLNDESRAFYINEIKDNQVMQYTGLEDKNDVEIYEGDIIRYTTCTKDKYTFNLEVLYEEELARFHIRGRYSNSSVIFSLTCDSVLDAEIKVIGNIYENKYLLNEI